MKNKCPVFLVFVFFLIPFLSNAQVHLVTSGFNSAGGDVVESQSLDYSFGQVISNPLETNDVKGNLGILQIIPDNMTSVNVERFSQMSVYPNPSLGVFEILNTEEESYSYRIYKTDGSLIVKGEHIGYSHSIDLGEYTSGVYLLNIVTGKKMQNIKLLKL